jgi:hypothetical protein
MSTNILLQDSKQIIDSVYDTLSCKIKYLEQLRTNYFPLSEEMKDGVKLIQKWFEQGETCRDRIISRLTQKGFSFEIAEWAWAQFQANPQNELP